MLAGATSRENGAWHYLDDFLAHLDDVLYTLYRNRVIQVYLWWKLSGPTMRVSSDDDWELHSLGAKDMTQAHGPS